MNIRDLQYLVMVAETRHFGRAAEKCFVSQPTLSTQLKKLELELGVVLFERNNKSVMITPVGEVVVQEARMLLRQVEKIKQIALNSKDPYAGVFRLGIIPTLGPYLLPHILDSIKKEFPNLELILVENKTDVILSQLRRGKLDAVILALPIKVSRLHCEELFREPFYVALPKDHNLSQQDRVTIKDIENENLLLLEEGHCLRDQALEACQLVGGDGATGFSATSLETLRQMVALGSGITLLPALSVKYARMDKSIVVRPFAPSVPSRMVGLLWREGSVREQCCRRLVRIISQQVLLCSEVSGISKMKTLTNELA